MDIILPELSPAMTAGTLAQWHKQVGDPVAAGEVLADIEIEKAVMELESPAAGRLEAILVPEGEEADVGTVIARLSASPASAQAPESGVSDELAGTPAASPPPPRAATRAAGNVPVSPRARRLARELGVALAGLAGSGPGGRIVERDVLAASGLPGEPGRSPSKS